MLHHTTSYLLPRGRTHTHAHTRTRIPTIHTKSSVRNQVHAGQKFFAQNRHMTDITKIRQSKMVDLRRKIKQVSSNDKTYVNIYFFVSF